MASQIPNIYSDEIEQLLRQAYPNHSIAERHEILEDVQDLLRVLVEDAKPSVVAKGHID